MIRTQKVVVHWLCLKGLRKLGRATTFHTPQATWKLGEWRRIPRASDWSITNCNSTVSTVARETNLGIVVPFETWLKNGHGWLEYSAKNSVWSMCWTVQYRQFLALTNCFISKKGSKKNVGISTYHCFLVQNWLHLVLNWKTDTSETWICRISKIWHLLRTKMQKQNNSI